LSFSGWAAASPSALSTPAEEGITLARFE
jgi:hypothetical protein